MPHEAKHASKHALGVVAGAAIPAAVIGSLALAPAAYAAPSISVPAPGSAAKSVTPENIKIAQDQIKAHLIASRVSTLGLPAKVTAKTITIPAGATLSGLAAEYHTSVAELKKLNKLSSDVIIAGKSLKVPGAGGSAKSPLSSQSSSSSASYTVKSGDTLSGIAAKHKMSLSELLKKNNISASDASRIFPGDKLTVSGSSSPAPASKPQGKKSSTPSSGNYTVKPGDTLGGIAAKHNMSLSALLSKNNISASKIIYPGEKLKVAGSASSSAPKSQTPKSTSTKATGTYTVKSGDTLSGIAAKHGMGLSSLLELNGISSSKLIFPGNKLKVSGGSSAPHSTPSPDKLKAPAKTSTYSVKSGDTLGGIASSHGMTLRALLDLNPSISTSTPLQIGTKLKLNGSSVQSTSTPNKPKIGNTFLGRTYGDDIVENANKNKDHLDANEAPSREQVKSMIISTAQRMGVDPALALAHGMQESGFNMRAVSPANAIGAMQVIPSTGEWMSSYLGQEINLLNPQDNITAGVGVIRYNLANTDNLDDAIAAYYQGLGGVRKYGMYEDTKRYVASVKSLMKQFS